jgi:hypothetical protein
MMVKKSGSKRTFVIMLGILACMIPLIFYLLFSTIHDWQIMYAYSKQNAIMQIFGLSYITFLALFAFHRIRSTMRREDLIDQIRQEATRTLDKQVALDKFLATKEPHIIAEPFVVKIRSRTIGAFFVISVIVIPTIPLIFLFGIQPKDMDLWEAELIAICMLIVIFSFTWVICKERLWVSSEGMGIAHRGRKHFIHWHDAHLFTVTHSNAKSYSLELASEKTIVRWFVFIAHPESVNCWIDIPFEEYQRKMDGLLLLIAERTGLPLIDLRDVSGH